MIWFDHVNSLNEDIFTTRICECSYLHSGEQKALVIVPVTELGFWHRVCRTKILISNLTKTYLVIRYTAAKFVS
jgi:hypothetical protein